MARRPTTKELADSCAKSWFNRFYKYRAKFFADGREPTDEEMAYLAHLYSKVLFYEEMRDAL